jgi:hypothetical protein
VSDKREGGDASSPWNSGPEKNDPRSPWNDERYRDDPTQEWNSNGGHYEREPY